MMLGVIIWDWTVSGGPRSEIEQALKIARRIGLQSTNSDTPFDWDNCEVASVKISGDEWDYLARTVRSAMTRRLTPRMVDSLREVGKNRPVILMASDAMKDAGAFIMMSPEGAELAHQRVKYSEQLNINYKETDIARLAVLFAARRQPGSEIRIAVDNSTAFVALKRRVFVADEEEQRLLDEMTASLRQHDCYLIPVQVPGIHQAADDRSRGEHYSVPERIRACVEYLLGARVENWFISLNKRRRAEKGDN